MADLSGISSPAEDCPPHLRIAIIGAGFSGIAMAAALRREQIEEFLIFERADDLGGTWRDNSYPGCACDVPSHLYSFSFYPNPNWSQTFSPQPEIWEYLRDCASHFGITEKVRFGHDLLEAAWEQEHSRWRIETSRGVYTADLLVSGTGPLSEPSIPDLPGLDCFEGSVFHSGAWDHDHDLGGERVAVIGTGASAIQFVPQIQPTVAKPHLFQRTAPWIMARHDRPISALQRRLYRRLPALQRLMRGAIYLGRELTVMAFIHPRLMAWPMKAATRFREAQIKDVELNRKLTPDYTFGCKRVLISNDYYPALTQPNVELVVDAIGEIRPRSIVTQDGVEREVDTIIFGTGFKVSEMAAAKYLRGRDGALLGDLWQGSPQAYRGTTVAGFPNLFLLVGPNTGLGHNSIVFMIESQVAYIMEFLRFMASQEIATFEVRSRAQEEFNRGVQEQMVGTVWTSGGCDSWYLDAKGSNTTLWPGFTWRFRALTRHFDPLDYVFGANDRGTMGPAIAGDHRR